MLPSRTRGFGFPLALDSKEPTQFMERHLIFLKQLGKVRLCTTHRTACPGREPEPTLSQGLPSAGGGSRLLLGLHSNIRLTREEFIVAPAL